MDVRLIIKEAGRRYTLPVKGIDQIVWSDDALPDSTEGGVLRCRRRGMDLLVIQADVVTRVYRDDAPPSGRGSTGARAGRLSRSTRKTPPDAPTAAGEERSGADIMEGGAEQE